MFIVALARAGPRATFAAMRPILFRAGELEVWSHPVFATLGILVAIAVTVHVSRRAGRADRALLFIIAGGLAGAAIFARFGLAPRYVQLADEPTLSGLLRYGGRTLLGGLVGGYLGVVLTKRAIGYTRATGDLFAPGVALGMAVGRIGCFLAEQPGTVTTLWWGVRVPESAVPLVGRCPGCVAGAPMHPSFLYESAFDIVAAWVLFALTRAGRPPARWMVEGDVFRAFLLAYAVFRVAVEQVRGNPTMAFGMSGSQITALISAIVLALYFARRRFAYRPATLVAETA
jgi:phosphatidylglycerol---prolipoprotein diacylglyceryl transferase